MGSSARKKKFFLLFGLFAFLAAAIGTYVSFGPPNLYAKSGSPEFCGSCHVIEFEYESWFHNGGHRRIKCIDCHLPNDYAAHHAFWKAVEGMVDSYAFYSGRVPETIKLSERGARTVQANCLRCHEETMARVNEDRNCWLCHRRLSHRQTGAF